jgi:hypothetical protein
MLNRSRLLTFTIALLSLIGTAMAQTTTGAITGTVTDPSGAAIPNVRVAATNTATNVVNATQSNDAGVYNFPFLAAGDYTIAAEVQGFKKVVIGPFRLEVNQIARVDPKLEVGAVTESVEIRDVAPVLQTETTQTGSVLSASKLTEIPLNGRNFANMTLLVPGAVSTNPQNMSSSSRVNDQGSRPYVNGNREQTNNFLLDGIDINDSIDNRVAYNPNVDALEEVKVLTGNAPAEFGNAAGAVVNAQIKSGTNEFKGNVFEFLRNDKLDANDFFNNRSNAPKRAFRRNIFGGTFGGPIRKNKAFFFMDYEGTRQRDSGSALASVPLAEYRDGNLSRFSQAQIRDPQNNNQPFPNKVIPASRIVNPVAKALFGNAALYPLPNQTGVGAIGVTNNYRGTSANALQNDQADAKVDLRLTDNDNLSARWSISRYFSGGSKTALPTIMTSAKNAPTTAAVATWVKTVSPTIVNELRIGYSRDVIGDLVIDPWGQLGADGNSKLGVPGGQPIPGASAMQIGDGITNVGSAAAIGETVENKYQIGNNLTIARGTHFLKIGAQIIRFHQNRYYAGNNGALGFFDFTAAKYSGSGYADFLLGLLSEKGRGSVAGKWGHRHSRAGIFFQDDWKAAKNLTINLGMRWEYTQPVYEVADRQSNFDLRTGKQLFAGKDGNSRSLYNAYHKQFMPRVGIAWQPYAMKNKMVVRGGYAIISFMEGTGANLRLPLNPPIFFESDTIYDLNKPGDPKLGFTDVLPLSTPSGNVRAWDPGLRPQFTQQWNLTIEQQFTSSFSLSVGYVGQKATHLVVPREGNQPLPGTGPVTSWAPLQTRRPLYSALPLVTTIATTDSPSTMDFHSLQTVARKRMGHGLDLVANFTWGKTLTDNRGFYGGGGMIAGEGAYWQNGYNRKSERGRSFFDARENFSLGGTWDLPVGKGRAAGKSLNKVADMIVGGWNTSFLLAAHSGFPVTIIGLDSTNQAVRGNVRANYYRALTYQNQSIDNWFGTGNTYCTTAGVDDGKCAYGYAAAGVFGNASIGTEQAPSYFGFDMSIGKRFKVAEKRSIDFRTEMFNIFNHASFGPPGRTLTAPASFGLITTQTTLPRQIQFGLKFFF